MLSLVWAEKEWVPTLMLTRCNLTKSEKQTMEGSVSSTKTCAAFLVGQSESRMQGGRTAIDYAETLICGVRW